MRHRCGAAGYTYPYGCEPHLFKESLLIRPLPIQESGYGFIPFINSVAKVINHYETTKFFFHFFINFALLLTTSISFSEFCMLFVTFMQYSFSPTSSI